MSTVILLNVDNRWKNYSKNDNILCCWFLNKKQESSYKNVHIYNLNYVQIINNTKSLFLAWKLTIIADSAPRNFLISSDCNYLLIFGLNGCNFLSLPNIYKDIYIDNNLYEYYNYDDNNDKLESYFKT